MKKNDKSKQKFVAINSIPKLHKLLGLPKRKHYNYLYYFPLFLFSTTLANLSLKRLTGYQIANPYICTLLTK